VRDFGAQIFEAAGMPQDQADIAVNHLVESNLMGHDSHGVIRIPNYVDGLKAGNLRPVGSQKVVRETPASMVVDANRSFGIVLAYESMRIAIERAKTHTFGAVAVHQSGHIGRLGAYPPMAAEQDCIGIVLLNGGGRFAAPFGGVAKRLPPNPISISVPVEGEEPMMLDVTTSVAAGGKVEVYRARGQSLPDGWLIDAEGKPVHDPARFNDPDVAMLPFGGIVAHKGYGLAVMIDAIAGGLSWAGCSSAKPTRGGSGYIALAINISSFIDPADFKRETKILHDWVKSSPTMPGHNKVYVPGEIESEMRAKRMAEGMPIEEPTWNAIVAAGASVGVTAPAIA
jgi:uncharacterized oxidoreductase